VNEAASGVLTISGKPNLSDFSFERAELFIVNPKGKKDRLAPVG